MPTVNIDVYARLHNAEKKIRDLSDEVDTLGKEAKTSDSKVKGLWKQVAGGILAVGGINAALRGATGLINSFMSVGRETENYKVRLEALLGSQDAATAAMDYFEEVASQVPFTLQDIIEAGTTVTAFGADLEKWTPILADLAAVMGMDVTEAAEALGRAYAGGAGAADIFRERGILQIIKDSVKLKTGLGDISKLTLPEFRDAMYDAFTDPEGKISGAADKLAGTWDGMISMLEDAWFQFRQEVMDAGVYDFLKGELKNILDKVKELKESGKLKEWAEKAAEGIKDVFKALKDIATFIKDYVLPAFDFLLGRLRDIRQLGKIAAFELKMKWLEFKDIWADVQDEMDAAVRSFHGVTEAAGGQDLALSELDARLKEQKDSTDKLSRATNEGSNKQKVFRTEIELTTTSLKGYKREIKLVEEAIVNTVMPAHRDWSGLAWNTQEEIKSHVFNAHDDIKDDVEYTIQNEISPLWDGLSTGISRSFGNAFEDILTEGSDFNDAMVLLIGGLKDSVIGFFGDMVTGFLKNNVFKMVQSEATKAVSGVRQTLGSAAKGAAGIASGGAGALAMGLGAAAGTFLGTLLGGGGMGKSTEHHIHQITDAAISVRDMLRADYKEEFHVLQNAVRDVTGSVDAVCRKSDIANKHLYSIKSLLGEVPSGQGGLHFRSGASGGLVKFHPYEDVKVSPIPIQNNISMTAQPIQIKIGEHELMNVLVQTVPEYSRLGYLKYDPRGVRGR
jgi:hypothetical protein